MKPLVELRVPFELERQAIDDVDRGANDSDWQPAKDAADRSRSPRTRHIRRLRRRRHSGHSPGTSNPVITLPAVVAITRKPLQRP